MINKVLYSFHPRLPVRKLHSCPNPSQICRLWPKKIHSHPFTFSTLPSSSSLPIVLVHSLDPPPTWFLSPFPPPLPLFILSRSFSRQHFSTFSSFVPCLFPPENSPQLMTIFMRLLLRPLLLLKRLKGEVMFWLHLDQESCSFTYHQPLLVSAPTSFSPDIEWCPIPGEKWTVPFSLSSIHPHLSHVSPSFFLSFYHLLSMLEPLPSLCLSLLSQSVMVNQGNCEHIECPEGRGEAWSLSEVIIPPPSPLPHESVNFDEEISVFCLSEEKEEEEGVVHWSNEISCLPSSSKWVIPTHTRIVNLIVSPAPSFLLLPSYPSLNALHSPWQ